MYHLLSDGIGPCSERSPKEIAPRKIVRAEAAGFDHHLIKPATFDLVTGKFVMEVREDHERNRALWIAVELSPTGAQAPPEPVGDAVAEAFLASLLRLNSEFANHVCAARRRSRITLWPTGHLDYFPVGGKAPLPAAAAGEPLSWPTFQGAGIIATCVLTD